MAAAAVDVSEGWILAGSIDGRDALPRLLDDVAGMPWVLRCACALAAGGARRLIVVWNGPRAQAPDLTAVAGDARLGGRTLQLSLEPPPGNDGDLVLVSRANHVFHRDLPRALATSASGGDPFVGATVGEEDAGVWLASRRRALALAEAAAAPGGLDQLLTASRGNGAIAEASLPYLAFGLAVRDAGSQQQAERLLVSSLRKRMDGLASKYLNRYFSLPVTRLIMRSGVRPNHVTVMTMLLGVAAGVLCATGGARSALLAIVLLELGSLIDGIDGELSRLKYQGSRLGQWMDTVSDNLANLSLFIGLPLYLDRTGLSWALPAGAVAVIAFVLAQSILYVHTHRAGSGNLAVFEWSFRPEGATQGPLARALAFGERLLKRDFFISVFLVLALLGRFDVVLAAAAGGAVVTLVAVLAQTSARR